MLEKLASNKLFDGLQLQYQHHSQLLACTMRFSVYLPPQAPQSPVPVIYWLSGLTCNEQNFVLKAGAQKYAAQYGVAIVCPDTSPRGDHVADDPQGSWDFGLGAGFYVDATQSPWVENYQMYSYVTAELPELIAKHFPIDASRSSISGHSMGGHGALIAALKKPAQYRCVSAFAPIVSPSTCAWGEKALGGYLGVNRAVWQAYDACALVSPASHHLPVLVDQGTADEFLPQQLQTERLVEVSTAANYPMNIRYQEGYDHSYFFIASFIEEHIAFHVEFLSI
ncbi:MAG: S-formylglutathione hydrolase [Pseudomonadales bacterium]|nr:S-formylglutathione hydrolase [Pseudomonadales bacterium]MDG2078940.1 S-formylglutathione hydrolase [Pseudomonadales bacterium]